MGVRSASTITASGNGEPFEFWNTDLGRHFVEIFPDFGEQRDAVATIFERLLMFDFARNVNAILSRRLRTVLKLTELFVHIALEVRNIAHRVDAHRTKPVRRDATG